jgi:Kdo2-lipid IVA lauroyltransferase/acyltransferase
MSTWRKKLKYTFLVFLVKSLIWISSWMPRAWLHAIFSRLAKWTFVLVKKERQKTIANIKIGYPEKSEAEAKQFAKNVFINLGKNYADLTKGLSIKTKEHYRKTVKIVGEEHFQKAFDKGNGVIALGCHLGAFELYGTYCGLHYPTVGVGARLKNKVMDELLVANRTSRGIDFSHRGEGTLKMLRSLKQGKVLIMLIDQDTDKVKNVFVDFYGKKAATPIGAALLAQKTGASVVPMAMSMQDGKQVLTIDHEIPVVVTGNEEADLETNTQNFTTASEKFIKAYPEQWVWIHERWKTRPSEN